MSDMKKVTIPTLAYASGIAAGNPGCGDGPAYLQQSSLGSRLAEKGVSLQWEPFIQPELTANKLSAVEKMCATLAAQTQSCVENKQIFAVLGGDHSSAIGTWSGVAAATHAEGPIGLIWIDAHLDSNDFETSPSGNIHGMPVAHLLGYGAKELSQILTKQPKILPNHLCFIGIRSVDEGEVELIKRLGIRIYDMHEIQSRGLNTIIKEAKDLVSKGTIGYGLSIDLDGLDPEHAPGVGTPEKGGIDADELVKSLRQFHLDTHLLGVEIAEFNPHLDKKNKTFNVIINIMSALFSDQA